MLHVDYAWDLSEEGIVIGNDIDITQFKWKEGDQFTLVMVNGRPVLRKVVPSDTE